METMLIEIEDMLSIENLSATSIKRYRRRLIEFCSFLSSKIKLPIEQIHLENFYYIPYDDTSGLYIPIDGELIDEYFETNIYRGYSWLSCTKSALSRLFKYLSVAYDFRNPMRDIEFKLRDHFVESNDKRALNRQEILKLIRGIIKYSENVIRDALLFITLFTTGCRINEILSLTPGDVKVDEQTFLLRSTKNGRQIYIATKLGIAKALNYYCTKNSIKKDSPIFQSNGNPLTQTEVRALLQYYLDKENLPRTRVHDTRRSFVTIMYANGSDISLIQQMINHVTLSSTQIYLQENAIRNEGVRIPILDDICKDLKKLVGH